MAERKLLQLIPLENTFVVTKAAVRWNENDRKKKAEEKGVRLHEIPDGEEAETNKIHFMKVWDDGELEMIGFDESGAECDPRTAANCVGFIFQGKPCELKAKKTV